MIYRKIMNESDIETLQLDLDELGEGECDENKFR